MGGVNEPSASEPPQQALRCDTVIVMGVSASGKSTVAAVVARRLGWAHIDADDFHPQANIDKMRAGTPLTDDDRVPWLDRMRGELDRRAAADQPAVLSCSALKRKYRDVLRSSDARVEFVHLQASRELLVERLDDRTGHFFPEELVDSQLAALEIPDEDEGALLVSAAADANDIADQVISAWS